ncbi:L,D-transpeptidase [Rhizobium sp. NFR03]|uniref:L,D-transpeptidase family protein n=1 Tax=Rhizobium sp. NFR03 TaxID=1566263 RepID=UPI0008C85480|nr:L,D-transpeptidase [Rhizobium sp. NFR03]SES47139.1 Lipoprotein-anchoring transpeptidase ErfK/SrfK [Rhizobium sp. NFR03]
MKNNITFALLISLGMTTAAVAQSLRPNDVNNASLDGLSDRPEEPSTAPDPALVRLQVLLDRAGASPGVIDGFYGANLTKAVRAFEAMHGLSVDGKLDAEVIAKLDQSAPAAASYTISDDDTKDIVREIPNDFADQAKMDSLGYTSVAEKLSERFHMDVDLLKALNPDTQFNAGDEITVVSPGTPREGKVKRIEAHRGDGTVFAYSEDGAIVAAYPATIGSKDNPTPSGEHKVNGVARMPKYTYNPDVNFQQGQNKKLLELPGGPNNPVGTVWIDLSEPTYGIHGTPEPSVIDKVGSHGCIRLANWDAEELAAMVKPGVIVDITD